MYLKLMCVTEKGHFCCVLKLTKFGLKSSFLGGDYSNWIE